MNRSSIQTGIWLIGLGVLFLTDFFWPGILILVGLSMLAGAFVPAQERRAAPSAAAPPVEQPRTETNSSEEEVDLSDDEIPPALGVGYSTATAKPIHSTQRLPEVCPMCGGPVLDAPDALLWTGPDSARCPYCDTELPLPEISGAEAGGGVA